MLKQKKIIWHNEDVIYVITIRILSNMSAQTIKEYLMRSGISCECVSNQDIKINASDLRRVNEVLTSFEIMYKRI